MIAIIGTPNSLLISLGPNQPQSRVDPTIVHIHSTIEEIKERVQAHFEEDPNAQMAFDQLPGLIAQNLKPESKIRVSDALDRIKEVIQEFEANQSYLDLETPIQFREAPAEIQGKTVLIRAQIEILRSDLGAQDLITQEVCNALEDVLNVFLIEDNSSINSPVDSPMDTPIDTPPDSPRISQIRIFA